MEEPRNANYYVAKISLFVAPWRGNQECLILCNKIPREVTNSRNGSLEAAWRSCQRRESDSQSSGPGFESRSDHYPDLFHGSSEFKSSAMLVNSQLVCLQSVGIHNNGMFNFKYLFQLFDRSHKNLCYLLLEN